ncbi:MAG: Sigma-54-dependent transcriptional activator [candidate division TM6 bacterium GW2011_GWF2_30_66]|nr:MAG: Sigma-54-dependent transcriptional activator [candidate division TM6 bacterium GW2011_GWF2_30_66]
MENLLSFFYNLTTFFVSVISDIKFIFFITTVSLAIKSFILGVLIYAGVRCKKINLSWALVFLVLISSIIIDLSWIIRLLQLIFFPSTEIKFIRFFVKIAWGFFIIQYQALALLIEKLSDKNNYIRFSQKIFLTLSCFGFLSFVFIAFYNYDCIENYKRFYLETFLLEYVSYFLLFLLIPYSIITTLYKIKKNKLPKIIKKQISVLIKFLILPLLITDIIALYPFSFIFKVITNSYAATGASTLLMTYAIFHCMRKIMGLRFLNMQAHVTEARDFDFINDFKNIINKLGQATTIKELEDISQRFFQAAFCVPEKRVCLYVRNIDKLKELDSGLVANNKCEDHACEKIEDYLKQYFFDDKMIDFLVKSKIIIIDELEFNNFYEENEESIKVFNFMTSISADIFIPILDKNKITAYIVVDRFARASGSGDKVGEFYSDLERDQMAVYVSYLENVIKLLQSKNLNLLIAQTKELKEELYLKHQENNQYKESIRSFLRYENQKEIGIIFYKNDKFSFGNNIASDLVSVKLNTYAGHPVTKRLKSMSDIVLAYGEAKSCFITNNKGEKLVASAILHIDKISVIISVRYPEVSDVLKKKIEFINDPTKLDYLLYLETTESGKLIDKLIPGNSERLLTYKIDLLKTALSKKAILIDIPEQDLLQTVEILHSISLRENLHILDLKKPSNNSDTAIRLFGISSIFGLPGAGEKPLLESLDNNGTLFIKNINYLEIETQKRLADFIKYGFFVEFRGDKKTFSDVRIICSTNVDLETEVNSDNFSKELFGQLKNTSISIPTLMLFSEKDINSITTSFVDQEINNYELSNVLEFTDKDKYKILQSKPVSFYEIKNKIQNIIEKKSNQTSTHEKVQLVTSNEFYDSDVIEAIHLGKRALKDEKIMRMLWAKFGNQNKMASLLGVNRSSINRRCKEYNII